MTQSLINEFSKMLPVTRLDFKAELIKDIAMTNKLIDDVDHLISVYSALDFVRVSELMETRARYMSMLLDLLEQSNQLYLGSIAVKAKRAVKGSKRA